MSIAIDNVHCGFAPNGIEVMRVAASEVERSAEKVIEAVVEACRKRVSREGDPGEKEPE